MVSSLARQLLRAVALPPLRPAAFFCAVVPPWLEEEREELECDFLPPRLDAPGEFAIRAARCFDIPFSFSFSYCFSFLTFALLPGMPAVFPLLGAVKRHALRATLYAWTSRARTRGSRSTGRPHGPSRTTSTATRCCNSPGDWRRSASGSAPRISSSWRT